MPSSSARLALAPQLSAHSADEEKVWGDEADNEGTILLSRQIVCSGLSEVPASSTKLYAPSASGLGTSARERKVFLPSVELSALLLRAAMLIFCLMTLFCRRACVFLSLSVLINFKRALKRHFTEIFFNVYEHVRMALN